MGAGFNITKFPIDESIQGLSTIKTVGTAFGFIFSVIPFIQFVQMVFIISGIILFFTYFV